MYQTLQQVSLWPYISVTERLESNASTNKQTLEMALTFAKVIVGACQLFKHTLSVKKKLTYDNSGTARC